MKKIMTVLVAFGFLALLDIQGCAMADEPTMRMELISQARSELADEPADSDAALILTDTLKKAQAAEKPADIDILKKGLARAKKARNFKHSSEAPLPEGWPAPSLPGLVRIKKYPIVRIANVTAKSADGSQFMTLFNHIKKQDIPMTAPVIMGYSDEQKSMKNTQNMGFLYRDTKQGKTGNFQAVDVRDQPVATYVSVAVMGSYRSSKFEKEVTMLKQWLKENPQWQANGPPRVLGYNSPFMPFWMKYSEVQIPVKPSTKIEKAKPAPLTAEEKRVIIDKGTERPFTGKYWDHAKAGTYHCRQCDAPLYKSTDKFKSNCGWPAFDDEITGAVTRVPDADGRRTEIICANCKGHLGHVFKGENLTPKNTRHCVNSISMAFKPSKPKTQKAIFAGGCFWGVEHYFEKTPGVLSAVSGYIDGTNKSPTYKEVCTGKTGHAEAVEVTFDPQKVSYDTLAKLFFEIHDPTELNRQGPDVGTQYRSAVYYFNDEQKKTAQKLIDKLKADGLNVVTQLKQASKFYPAEDYHQNFVTNNPGRYTCHRRVKRF